MYYRMYYTCTHTCTHTPNQTSEPDDWSIVPDPTTSKRIYDKCVGMVPELEMAGVEVIGSWACLRPARVSGVRVEVEYVMMGDEGRGRGRGKERGEEGRGKGEEGRRREVEIERRGEGGGRSAGYRSPPLSVPVVHGYGHGGQGVLSSWAVPWNWLGWWLSVVAS